VLRFRLGKIWTLISTDLMARGIDFKGVNLVINYDFPTSTINYIHRVGRTGRANRTGKAITLFTDEDKPMLRSIGNVLKISGCPVPDWIFKLKKGTSEQIKHAKVYPVKRETISTDIEKNVDPAFKREMARKDKVWEKRNNKKLKKNNATEAPEKGEAEGDSEWQTVTE